MMAAVMARLGLSWLTLLKWGALALLILGILLKVRNDGRNEERVVNLERALENARAAREIDRAVGAATDDELDDGLRPPAARR